MTEQTHQSRSTLALAAAAADLTAAERAARNINRTISRRCAHEMRATRDPVNLTDLITALLSVHDITGHLSQIVWHYAQAVRWPLAGYTSAFGEHTDFPDAVTGAASRADYELTALAAKLKLPAVGFSTDAIASLDIALADWRTANRRNGAP